MAARSKSLIRRILLWAVFVLAAAVVSFFIGYLVGPFVIDRIFPS